MQVSFTKNCLRLNPQRLAAGITLLWLAVSAWAATAPEQGSSLTYSGGRTFHTIVQDAVLLGELPVRGGAPILFFSGHLPDETCGPPYCDSQTSVFIQPASSQSNRWNAVSFRYPGDYYTVESRKLAARVRMFFGRCIDERTGPVWIVEKLDVAPSMVESVWRNSATAGFVTYVKPVGGVYGERDIVEYISQMAVARAAVSKGRCREITPNLEIYRPAAAYAAPWHPKPRTDCSTPAFDPRDVALARGSAGKPVSYLDERTGIVFYVESDGRHLVALDHGQLLWVRDPFVDQDLCPYRVDHPVIFRLGPLPKARETDIVRLWKRPGPFIEIHFDSSQFGVIDLKTGDFLFEGQN